MAARKDAIDGSKLSRQQGQGMGGPGQQEGYASQQNMNMDFFSF